MSELICLCATKFSRATHCPIHGDDRARIHGLECALAQAKAALAQAERERDAALAKVAKLEWEMARYLPILIRAEAMTKQWHVLTTGTGIATLNGYKHALNPTGTEAGS